MYMKVECTCGTEMTEVSNNAVSGVITSIYECFHCGRTIAISVELGREEDV